MSRRTTEAPQHVVMDSKESAFFTMWDAEARHHEGIRGRCNYARNAVVTEASRGHQFTESGAIVSCRDARMAHISKEPSKLHHHFKNRIDEKIPGTMEKCRVEIANAKTGKRIYNISKTSNLSVKDGHTPVEDKCAGMKYGKKILTNRYENPNPIQIYDGMLGKSNPKQSSRTSSAQLCRGEASFRSSRSRSRLGQMDDTAMASVRTVDSSYSTLSYDELEQKRTIVSQELERLERILNGSEQYTS